MGILGPSSVLAYSVPAPTSAVTSAAAMGSRLFQNLKVAWASPVVGAVIYKAIAPSSVGRLVDSLLYRVFARLELVPARSLTKGGKVLQIRGA
jgi:hypothetical protein